jgi:hypothetical protein
MTGASSFSFDLLDRLSGNKAVADAPCPSCGPECRTPANQRRKVLRIWNDGDFITYKCARCEASGYAKAIGSTATSQPRPRPAPSEPEKDKAELARYLWSKSLPLVGSLAEAYLKSRACFIASENLRFLPARGEHRAAMIARFGTGEVTGVHLTKLRADGLAKAGTENDKIIIGPSIGQSIILLDNEEREELNVAEGIEDAASCAIATGWSSWAAGTANRIAPVITTVPRSSKIFLASDLDWGKPARVRAGPRALRKAIDIRPDLVPLHFEKALGIKVDANKALIQFGPDVVLAVFEWCEASAQYAHGEIGFEAMMRASHRSQDIFRTLAGDTM